MTRRFALVILAGGIAATLALAGCTADRNETDARDGDADIDRGQDRRPDPGGEPTGPDPNELDPDRRINDGFGPR